MEATLHRRRAKIRNMGLDYQDTTGQRIRWARNRAALTQSGLALEVDVLHVYISQIENGKRLPEHIAIQHIGNEMQRLTAVDVDRLLAADNSAGKTQAAIDAARRQLERLTKALQDADDARFIAGTLDDLRYVRTVERIRNEIATTEAELSQLDDKQRREAQQGDKRARLLDVLHNGMDYLRSGNPTQANAWLRSHIRVWAQGREVVLVDWL